MSCGSTDNKAILQAFTIREIYISSTRFVVSHEKLVLILLKKKTRSERISSNAEISINEQCYSATGAEIIHNL